jgi:hypothetical protein
MTTTMQEWQQYSYTTEQLKLFCRVLKVMILFTFQLVDSVLTTGELSSNSIANGKHIMHHLDFCILGKQITLKEKDSIHYRVSSPNNPQNGQVLPLKDNLEYYIYKIIKNRAGMSNISVVMEVNKGRLTYNECGFLSKSW